MFVLGGCGRRRLPRAVLSATRGLFFLGNFCLFVRMRALLDSVRETPPHLVAVVALFVRVYAGTAASTPG